MTINTWISAALVFGLAGAAGSSGSTPSSAAIAAGAVMESVARAGAALDRAPQFSVSISGPSKIRPSTACTWFAIVSGGTLPYTYQWVGGAAISQYDNAYEASATRSFYLDLTVYDGNGLVVGTASKYVTVSSTAGACMI